MTVKTVTAKAVTAKAVTVKTVTAKTVTAKTVTAKTVKFYSFSLQETTSKRASGIPEKEYGPFEGLSWCLQ